MSTYIPFKIANPLIQHSYLNLDQSVQKLKRFQEQSLPQDKNSIALV